MKTWRTRSHVEVGRSGSHVAVAQVRSRDRVLVKVDFRLCQALSSSLHTATLHGDQDDDDGAEDGDDHPGNPDGDNVLLLEAFFDDNLWRFGRKGDDDAEAEVGDCLPSSVLCNALESSVVVKSRSQKNQLALDRAFAKVDVLVVVEAHVDVADQGGAVVDQQAVVPPTDRSHRGRGHRAHQRHVLALFAKA